MNPRDSAVKALQTPMNKTAVVISCHCIEYTNNNKMRLAAEQGTIHIYTNIYPWQENQQHLVHSLMCSLSVND